MSSRFTPSGDAAGDAAAAAPVFGRRSLRPGALTAVYRGATRFWRRQPIGAIAALILGLFALVAVLGPAITPYDPAEIGAGARLDAPSLAHPFGTDDRARDVLSRTMAGARLSLQVSFIAVGIGLAGGTALGVTTGFLGGFFDLAVQRLMDALLAFPGLVLALTFAALLGPGITNVMVAIGIVIIPNANRIVRGQTLSVAQNQYVDAARTLGASELRIITRHILPNIFPTIIVIASIIMGFAILIEASLAFLGIGADLTTPSWGQSLSAGRTNMEFAWWLVIAPGGAITLVVLAFNLFGDAVRDELDPSLRGSRGG